MCSFYDYYGLSGFQKNPFRSNFLNYKPALTFFKKPSLTLSLTIFLSLCKLIFMTNIMFFLSEELLLTFTGDKFSQFC